MRKVWRLALLGLMGMLTAYTPAAACDTIDNHIVIMWPDMPDTENIDTSTVFVGEVTITQKRKWGFFKQDKSEGLIAFIHKSPTHPDLEGTRINVFPVLETSCGPYIDEGDRGFVTANISILEDASPLPTLQARHSE